MALLVCAQCAKVLSGWGFFISKFLLFEKVQDKELLFIFLKDVALGT